jgi:hypothetical protein
MYNNLDNEFVSSEQHSTCSLKRLASIIGVLAHTITLTDDVMETISEFVSEYGLLVDAYWLGQTIGHMVSGVPPHKSVSEATSDQES